MRTTYRLTIHYYTQRSKTLRTRKTEIPGHCEHEARRLSLHSHLAAGHWVRKIDCEGVQSGPDGH